MFFKGNKKASKLYSIIGPFLIESSREPSGVSTINTVPGSQWSLWIIPMATFVLKSGDQAAEVTFPTKILFLRISQLFLQGVSGFPRISRKRICRQGPVAISSRRDSLFPLFVVVSSTGSRCRRSLRSSSCWR